MFEQIRAADLRVLLVIRSRKPARIRQHLPVIGKFDELLPDRLIRDRRDPPRRKRLPCGVHPPDLLPDHIVPERSFRRLSGQCRLELDDLVAVADQAAPLDIRFRKHFRPQNMQDLAIGIGVLHFKADACPEVLSHSGRDLLGPDAAGGDQQEYAVPYALLDQLAHDRLVCLPGLLVEASVIVDHDEDRRDRPSVVIDIIREIRALKEPFSLGNDLSDQREELRDPVVLSICIGENASDMD